MSETSHSAEVASDGESTGIPFRQGPMELVQ